MRSTACIENANMCIFGGGMGCVVLQFEWARDCFFFVWDDGGVGAYVPGALVKRRR